MVKNKKKWKKNPVSNSQTFHDICLRKIYNYFNQILYLMHLIFKVFLKKQKNYKKEKEEIQDCLKSLICLMVKNFQQNPLLFPFEFYTMNYMESIISKSILTHICRSILNSVRKVYEIVEKQTYNSNFIKDLQINQVFMSIFQLKKIKKLYILNLWRIKTTKISLNLEIISQNFPLQIFFSFRFQKIYQEKISKIEDNIQMSIFNSFKQLFILNSFYIKILLFRQIQIEGLNKFSNKIYFKKI
ncbi:hypothetical protein TTHERM_000857959 (macronuclear) [Tetrahymena thermophila SB210]|uniref:Uncharacterized protein n=1 Tax=Tetrahymena thermophila (strain SB210) TaxID=312017 RepID=W7XHZ1_TETTS|nr:hypothetical protein TTHERM_000857959 [Tetrahymena thermophila SB210]EWS72834.1 hypothetical protein TTHERM_000857959 [Tetrahymena thermophila SB210]|eukprot:XP_012654625.1 hypothetical protein TTHERM_000857959 [Tetrahymena thermophila SB210]